MDGYEPVGNEGYCFSFIYCGFHRLSKHQLWYLFHISNLSELAQKVFT